MFRAVDHDYLVPFGGGFRVDDAPTAPPKKEDDKKDNEKELEKATQRLAELQRVLYAEDRHAVLLVFQAMDAAGKDSTIRAVTTGVSPAGFQVFDFKQPSYRELDHDFLWRVAYRLPERGRIGIFNRSHYEEVLVARVHPELLDAQRLPYRPEDGELWMGRFESIRAFEQHLARNGTVVLKFFLHVSKDEQRKRFLDRIEENDKNWKFNAGDVEERKHWDAYMAAYEEALNQTSRPWAPWYAIPADDKPYMRRMVGEIVVRSIEALDLRFPKLSDDERKRMLALKDELGKG